VRRRRGCGRSVVGGRRVSSAPTWAGKGGELQVGDVRSFPFRRYRISQPGPEVSRWKQES
jgi:hypothetical protein